MPYEVSMGAGLAHRLELEGRERLTVSGVEDVERFDESTIVMATCAGTMVISGEGLHIGKLSLDGGEMHVDGRIDAVSYEDAPAAGGSPMASPISLCAMANLVTESIIRITFL